MITSPSAYETIIAIATPPGNGAIGIIRVSGYRAIEIVQQRWQGPSLKTFNDRQLYRGKIVDPSGISLDQVLCFVARTPHSYTGEDIVEIQAHGGRWLLEKIVSTLVAAGARLADPGEFTCRAFHNGKMDLAQAEGVADLIAATSERASELARRQLEGRLSETVGKMRRDLLVMRAQMEAMIDFPEDEDVQGLQGEEVAERMQILARQIRQILSTYREGRALREGVRVALIGKPNVGKSSLLNALLQQDRAIVHETPGTTRDLVEEVMDLRGLQVRFIDTAGIRGEPDAIEAEGIRRTQERLRQSDLVLALFDSSRPLDDDDQAILGLIKDREAFRLITKVDLAPKFDASELTGATEFFSISAQRGDGLPELKRAIRDHFVGQSKNTEVLFRLALAKPDARLNRGESPISPQYPPMGVTSPRLGGEMLQTENLLTHLRHKVALERGLVAMEKVREAATQRLSLEFLAADLTIAANALGEITGEITTDEVLGEIFSKFCLGK